MHSIQPNVSNGGGVPPIVFTSCEMLDAAHESSAPRALRHRGPNHYMRDVTFDEDRSHIRSGAAPLAFSVP